MDARAWLPFHGSGHIGPRNRGNFMTNSPKGPVGWLFKLLVLIGKFMYFFVRILLWILRRLRPKRW